jgi:hypothetical protein
MSSTLFIPYLMLGATLAHALLVKSNVVAPRCGGCGRPRERRALGDRICRCK